MVEHLLAKEGVASSNLVFRSIFLPRVTSSSLLATLCLLFHHGYVTARTDIPRRTDIDAPIPYRQNKHVLFGQQKGCAPGVKATSRSSCSRLTTASPALAAARTTWRTCNCSAQAATASRGIGHRNTWWRGWQRSVYDKTVVFKKESVLIMNEHEKWQSRRITTRRIPYLLGCLPFGREHLDAASVVAARYGTTE